MFIRSLDVSEGLLDNQSLVFIRENLGAVFLDELDLVLDDFNELFLAELLVGSKVRSNQVKERYIS